MINTFCEKIGVSRKGNENLTSYKKLEFYAREELNATAPRVFGVLDPIMLEIVNFDEIEKKEFQACIFPPDTTRGVRTLRLSKNVFIDRADFSEEEKKGFFGVMPGQVVCLRYGVFVIISNIVKDSSGNIEKVQVTAKSEHSEKVKGVIHWVS